MGLVELQFRAEGTIRPACDEAGDERACRLCPNPFLPRREADGGPFRELPSDLPRFFIVLDGAPSPSGAGEDCRAAGQELNPGGLLPMELEKRSLQILTQQVMPAFK